MLHSLFHAARRQIFVAWQLAIGLATAATLVQAAPPVHYLQQANLPPGNIGHAQLQRGGALSGYFQPVEIRAPKGSLVSLAVEGNFADPVGNTAAAGMLIGEVYRLRIGNIPRMDGTEVFPSVEVVNRLYPPPGQTLRFPIRIDITQEDLEMAAIGKFVTRVIYLEDPEHALPVKQAAEQGSLDVTPGEDPLRTADQLGRPMAIVRLGSRTPELDPGSGRFLFRSPSLLLYEKPSGEVPRTAALEKPLQGPLDMGRPSRNFPRSPPGTMLR